jgi:hypothetical protein
MQEKIRVVNFLHLLKNSHKGLIWGLYGKVIYEKSSRGLTC